MKKRILIASILLLTLVLLAVAGCSPQAEGFAIYLTRNNVSASQLSLDISIADEPIISTKDIVAYYKDTHEIELTAEAYERLTQLKVPTNGVSFVVCVDKQLIYWGAFWAPYSSQSFDGVTIWVPSFNEQENTITIELGYPSPSFYQGEDPRSNPVILESLEKAGKLK
jgi:hypothetical protein